MSRRDPGFTLLEVLAAVALLGILYTTLAGVAIQGLRSEGMSRRRLEASIVADRRIAELELQMEAGTVPPEGTTQEEDDPYVITVTVEPYDIPLPPPEFGEEQESVLAALRQLSPGTGAPVRRIDVKVTWLEAEDEYSVERTTFGFDLLAVESLVEATGGLPSQAPPENTVDQNSLEDQLP